MKKLFAILISAILVVSAIVGITSCGNGDDDGTGSSAGSSDDGSYSSTGSNGNSDENINETKYNQAFALIDEGKYEEAYEVLEALGDYKDAKDHLERFGYFPTVIEYVLSDRSGVMTSTLGEFNLPTHMVSEGTVGVKDGVYTYDEKGLLLQQSVTYEGVVSTYDYSYDANDRMILAEYRQDGTLVSYNEYEYDEKGNCTREAYILGDEVYYNYRNYYDENGRVERIESEVDGYVYTFTYNEDGNRTAERGEAPDGTYYTIALTYTENGELAKEVYTSGDNVETVDYAYNTEGYRTKMVLTLSNGYQEMTTWEYDENGNAIKEEFTSTDGGYECVETQYTFVYLTIDVPAATLSQLKIIYTIR